MEKIVHIYAELTEPYASFIEEKMAKWKCSKAEVIKMALRGWMIDDEIDFKDQNSACELIEKLYEAKYEAIPLKDLPFN